MIKRAVVLPAARGYVDGRFIGEEKEADDRNRKGRGGQGGRRGKQGDSILADNIGNTTRKKRGGGKGNPRGKSASQNANAGSAQSARNKRRGTEREGRGGQRDTQGVLLGVAPDFAGHNARGGRRRSGQQPRQRKGSTGKNTPFRNPQQPAMLSPTQSADLRRGGDEAKSGQFAEALAASANIKRERLHKVLAQSGHGSRRDMEIMIASGRVMVNGMVATAGTQVSAGDRVLVDLRPVKLKFSEDLPRVLLYHKPEGEIVTTSDPGNRITVFDNLPRVENGKWVAVGRLDINTSGLLIFTTSGELANRFMHPRFEVEREYAVRILGELTEEQTQQLLAGIKIEDEKSDGDDDRFNRIDAVDDDDFAEDELPYFVDDVEDAGLPLTDPAYDVYGAEEAQGNDQPRDLAPVHAAPVPPPKSAFVRDGLARFDVIEKRGGEGVNQWYHVVIREGRNREVRKMFEVLGLTVSRLIRTRFGKVELPPRLLRGKMVELSPDQVRGVLASVGMKVSGPTAPLDARGAHAPRGQRGQARGGNRGRRGPAQEGGDASGVNGNARERGPNDSRRRRGKPSRPRDDQPLVLFDVESAGDGESAIVPSAGDQRGPRVGIANKNRRRSRRGRGRTHGSGGARVEGGDTGNDVVGGEGQPRISDDAGNRVVARPESTGELANNGTRERSKTRRAYRGRRRGLREGGNGGSHGDGNGNGGEGGDGSGSDDFGNR